MSKATKPTDLANEINDILKDFKDTTEESLKKATTETAKETVDFLKKYTPSGAGKYHNWKDYQGKWTQSNNPNYKGKGKIGKIVHNEKYQLTHLLENGHVMRNGKRSKAYPHIALAEDEAEKTFMENIRKGIGQ